ncbi:hypothetical protein GTY86_14255 [Streptomyces sp. SID5770]|nr:hypothetical protein [Streptomyces sp. SID5770]
MIYAIKPSGGYTKKDFPRFFALPHRRLDGPVTVVWDNYSSHISKHVKQYAQQQDWLTIIQMPSYAPELNPVELLWAHAKKKIANRAFRSIDELHRATKNALRYIQRHPRTPHRIPSQNRPRTDPASIKPVIKNQYWRTLSERNPANHLSDPATEPVAGRRGRTRYSARHLSDQPAGAYVNKRGR